MRNTRKVLFIISLFALFNLALPLRQGYVSTPGGGVTINSDMPPIDTI